MSKGGGNNQSKQGMSWNMAVTDPSNPGETSKVATLLALGTIAAVASPFVYPLMNKAMVGLKNIGCKLMGLTVDSGNSGEGGGDGGNDGAVKAAHQRIGQLQGEFNALKASLAGGKTEAPKKEDA